MDSIIGIGNVIKDCILWFASLLVNDYVPGVVVLLLLLFLLVLVVWFTWVTIRRISAIKWFTKSIQSIDETDFPSKIDAFSAKIKDEASKERSRIPLMICWAEYLETLIAYEDIYRNSVRPAHFFNIDDLGFNPGFFRIIPGLFVTTGLLLTFLGLISALTSMTEINSNTMQNLMKVASAKFIMSLTGLFCSIVFTILFRALSGQLERKLNQLCQYLEKRLNYISLESLATKQLNATIEQREHFRTIGTELVAQLGKPLREELPKAISSSIAEAMAPLINDVGNLGVKGMGDIVSGLSDQLTDTITSALEKASQSLLTAGDKIAHLADRMDMSSGKIGSEMETVTIRVAQAVEDLRNAMVTTAESTGSAFTQGASNLLSVMNDTLEGIRDNTADGATAMREAAIEMQKSAIAFGDEINKAAQIGAKAAAVKMQSATQDAENSIQLTGMKVAESISKTTGQIAKIAEELAESASRDLMSPMNELAEKLKNIVIQLENGNLVMQRMAQGVRLGSEAANEAAITFKGAASSFVAAASPLQSITERIETSTRNLSKSAEKTSSIISDSAQSVAISAQQTASTAANALESAQDILGQQSRTIQHSLIALNNLLDNMKGQGDRLDQMDEKLGKAFEIYREQVELAVNGMHEHVRKIQEELTPALETMRTVVEQAESFVPESRRI